MDQEQFQLKVVEHMATSNTRLENIEGWMGKIDTKVTKISSDGCAKGGENERRIDKMDLKSRAGGAAAGGGIAAALVGMIELVRFLFGGGPVAP